MNRRRLLQALPAVVGLHKAMYSAEPSRLSFVTVNRKWQSTYDAAMRVLEANVQMLPRFSGPVLIEGASYQGVWQECGPQEALLYRHVRKDVARNGHMTFFSLQKEDGQLPANNKRTETGFGQIQMVVPIAATAWELASATGDDALLRTAYSACSRWDAWLMKYRNTRGTGLVEGFCTYDTGHDNSPRWAGIPPQCPGKDAKKFPPIPTLPRLCPDLSATVYGGRRALSAMADALGKHSEAASWAEKAEHIQKLILQKLYVPEDGAFYDLDATGNFVKVRSDVLSRVCGEHVVDQKLFDDLWSRQLHNEKAFWAPLPLPSIALDDSAFVRPIPRNSWGGASQALTALRAGRWFGHYRRDAEFHDMMDRWCAALQKDGTFRQQADPRDGVFTEAGEPQYSPAALVMMEYTWRLAGVCEESETLEWNVQPGHAAAQEAIFQRQLDQRGRAELRYQKHAAELKVRGKTIARWHGGAARLVTDKYGRARELVGISQMDEVVTFHLTGESPRTVRIKPNERIRLVA